jgi:hypothetical protein
MKINTILALAVFGLAGIGVAQDFSAKPAPGQNEHILGPQLIAWSELQKPQPLPQKPEPLPPPDTRSGEPQQQPTTPGQQGDQQGKAEQQPEPETQGTMSQSVTGTIVRVGGKYVLETSDNIAYQLDDQDRAKQYDGKHVKVMGTLDRSTGLLHVRSIELIS